MVATAVGLLGGIETAAAPVVKKSSSGEVFADTFEQIAAGAVNASARDAETPKQGGVLAGGTLTFDSLKDQATESGELTAASTGQRGDVSAFVETEGKATEGAAKALVSGGSTTTTEAEGTSGGAAASLPKAQLKTFIEQHVTSAGQPTAKNIAQLAKDSIGETESADLTTEAQVTREKAVQSAGVQVKAEAVVTPQDSDESVGMEEINVVEVSAKQEVSLAAAQDSGSVAQSGEQPAAIAKGVESDANAVNAATTAKGGGRKTGSSAKEEQSSSASDSSTSVAGSVNVSSDAGALGALNAGPNVPVSTITPVYSQTTADVAKETDGRFDSGSSINTTSGAGIRPNIGIATRSVAYSVTKSSVPSVKTDAATGQANEISQAESGSSPTGDKSSTAEFVAGEGAGSETIQAASVSGQIAVARGGARQSSGLSAATGVKERKPVSGAATEQNATLAAGSGSGQTLSAASADTATPVHPGAAREGDSTSGAITGSAVAETAASLPLGQAHAISAATQDAASSHPSVSPGGNGAAASLSVNGTANVSQANALSPDSLLSPLAHQTLEATPTVLEVGVPSGTHGWLKIRAEIGEGGTVQASMSAATHAGQETLRRELPAINSFLSSEQVPVSVQVAHGVASASSLQGAAESSFGMASSAGSSLMQNTDSQGSPAGRGDGAQSMTGSDGGTAQSGGQQQDGRSAESRSGHSVAIAGGSSVGIEVSGWQSSSEYGTGVVANGGSWLNVMA